jgi:putative glutamine amidotransferase
MALSTPDRPLICVAPRIEERIVPGVTEKLAPLEGGAVDFVDALVTAGAMPVMMRLTHDAHLIASYVELCAGLALPGGQDVNPLLWGDTNSYADTYYCDERDTLELALVRAFLAVHKPIFGTCRGMQLLNVALGGTLSMAAETHAPRPGMQLWRHTAILSQPAHPVEVKEGSLLARCVGGATCLQTNSSHHCCVERLGDGVKLVAEATDGMPEGIEVPSERFCLAVQWHPECTWRDSSTDALLWQSFVEACR